MKQSGIMVQESDTKKSSGAEEVKVVVRCRPMNEQETAARHKRFVYYHYK